MTKSAKTLFRLNRRFSSLTQSLERQLREDELSDDLLLDRLQNVLKTLIEHGSATCTIAELDLAVRVAATRSFKVRPVSSGGSTIVPFSRLNHRG